MVPSHWLSHGQCVHIAYVEIQLSFTIAIHSEETQNRQESDAGQRKSSWFSPQWMKFQNPVRLFSPERSVLHFCAVNITNCIDVLWSFKLCYKQLISNSLAFRNSQG